MHGRVRPVELCRASQRRVGDVIPTHWVRRSRTHMSVPAGRTAHVRAVMSVLLPLEIIRYASRYRLRVRRIIIRVLCAQHSNASVNNSGTRPSIRKQCMQCCTNPPIPQLQPELARNHAATTLSATALCSHYCAMSTCYIPLNPQLRLVSRDTEASTSSTVT